MKVNVSCRYNYMETQRGSPFGCPSRAGTARWDALSYSDFQWHDQSNFLVEVAFLKIRKMGIFFFFFEKAGKSGQEGKFSFQLLHLADQNVDSSLDYVGEVLSAL